MADGNGNFFINSRSGGRSRRDGDFEEEDVWGMVKEGSEDSSSKMGKSKSKDLSSSSRMILPRGNYSTGASINQQSSAPVDIPDWSKIYRKKNSKKKGSKTFHDFVDDAYDDDDDDDDDDGHDDGEMVPPHEYIAKKLARSQISSFSMCEGIGRTLKGRDLSKVRNAILSKTGFLE